MLTFLVKGEIIISFLNFGFLYIPVLWKGLVSMENEKEDILFMKMTTVLVYTEILKLLWVFESYVIPEYYFASTLKPNHSCDRDNSYFYLINL